MISYSEFNLKKPEQIKKCSYKKLHIDVIFGSDMGHLDLVYEFKENIQDDIKLEIKKQLNNIIKLGIDYKDIYTKPDSQCKYSCRFYKPLIPGKSLKLNEYDIDLVYIDETI